MLPGFSNLANAAVVFPLQSSVVSDSCPSMRLFFAKLPSLSWSSHQDPLTKLSNREDYLILLINQLENRNTTRTLTSERSSSQLNFEHVYILWK